MGEARGRAYYNENNPFTAAWLRNLIAAGLIADGVVDERSIVDVEPPTSEDTTKSISSPASADGATPCASLIGQTTSRSGPAQAPVSRFRSSAADKVMPTSGTSGQPSTVSSPSAALQSSLESRLRAVTDLNGSLEFVLIWKTTAMPSGPPICALRASARRTTGPGYTLWPTPTLSMSQPGADVSITGKRPDGTHATTRPSSWPAEFLG